MSSLSLSIKPERKKTKRHPDCLASEGKRRVRSPPQGQRWQLQFPISCDFADWRVKIDAAPPSAADCQLLVVCCEQQLLQIFPVDEARNARALPPRLDRERERVFSKVAPPFARRLLCLHASRTRGSPLTDTPWLLLAPAPPR